MKQFCIAVLLPLSICRAPAADITVEQLPAESKIVIPQTLDEAVDALGAILSDQTVAVIKRGGRWARHRIRCELGIGLRHLWGLEADSVLAKHFNELGIADPGSMCAIIIDTYARRIRNEPLEVEKQIAIHKAFWDSRGPILDAQVGALKQNE